MSNWEEQLPNTAMRAKFITQLLEGHGFKYQGSHAFGGASGLYGVQLVFDQRAKVNIFEKNTEPQPQGPLDVATRLKQIFNTADIAIQELKAENKVLTLPIHMNDLTLRELQHVSGEAGIKKGFRTAVTFKELYTDAPVQIPARDYAVLRLRAMLLKIITEVTEIDEALTKSDIYAACEKDSRLTQIGEELADIVIRVADLAHFVNVDLQDDTIVKLSVNAKRPFRHGNVN